MDLAFEPVLAAVSNPWEVSRITSGRGKGDGGRQTVSKKGAKTP